LDTFKNISEIPFKILDVILQKDRENHLDRLCKKKEASHGVKYKKNIIRTINRRKTNWIGSTLLRNRLPLLLKKIRETITVRIRRRGRRCKQLLNNLRENRRCWNLREEAFQCSVCGEHALERPVDFTLRQNME
jgi:hypothetical protein